MKPRIICFGKLKSAGLLELEAEYLKRLKPLLPTEILELKSCAPSSCSAEETKTKEGVQLLSKIPTDEFIVALDEHGTSLHSMAFAQLLTQWTNQGVRTANFVIGGAYGLSSDVLKRANYRLALSALTFPYQLARLITVEQLYRAATIIKGQPYHKQ